MTIAGSLRAKCAAEGHVMRAQQGVRQRKCGKADAFIAMSEMMVKPARRRMTRALCSRLMHGIDIAPMSPLYATCEARAPERQR